MKPNMHVFMGLAFLFIAGLSLPAFGQKGLKEEAEMINQIFGKEKKALVEQYMKFSTAESAAFWPVFDEYSAKSRELAAEKVRVLNHYAENYGKFTTADADLMVKTILDNDASMAKLQKKYYGKLKKAIDPVRAAQFLQMERYLQSSVWQAVTTNIPFIGELNTLRN